MFYPQLMTEIELIVPAKDMLEVTRTLAGQGTFHQIDTSYLTSEGKKLSKESQPKPTESWQQKSGAYTSLERRIANIMQTLDIEKSAPPREEEMTTIEVDDARPIVDEIEGEVRKVTDQRTENQRRLEQLESYLNQLEPLCDLDVDIGSLENSRYVFAMLGTIPTPNVERLQMSLVRIPYMLLPLKHEDNHTVVWMAGSQQYADVLERASRSAYLNPLRLPEQYHGSVSEVNDALQHDTNQARENIRDAEDQLKKLGDQYREQLQKLFWQINASRVLADAIAHYGQLQHTYMIFGWVPSSRLAMILERLRQVSKAIVIETFPVRRSGAHGDVPVTLSSVRALRPFQQLVTTFGNPRYDEVDPTILMAITFPLLFGAMFGDVGHGIELALLGLLLSSRKVKFLNSLAGLGRLITVCGVSAILFGFLYGSIFGLEDVIHPLWLAPIHNIMTILLISVAGGVVLLSLGVILGIINAYMARDWGSMLFDRNGIAGLVLYWSLLLIVLKLALHLAIPMPLLIATAVISFIGIAFSEVWKHMLERIRPLVFGGIGTYLIQVFFEMFETLTSYLSNSLSYVRVGAFAVAHAGLSSVFFILATMVSPTHGIGYWILVVIGNIFIIAFEGLIVGIQTMRLEYYEFFSKFFKGGGVRSEPLTLGHSLED